jgi:hypothetical protein
VKQHVYSWNGALMNQVQMYIKTQPLTAPILNEQRLLGVVGGHQLVPSL